MKDYLRELVKAEEDYFTNNCLYTCNSRLPRLVVSSTNLLISEINRLDY